MRINNSWNYLCAIIDLYNREIIGYSVGKNKTAESVKEAIQRINRPLSDIKIFHTDRGSEFKNKEIDNIISAFGITPSLNHKGCPYHNAVAEATYNIKTEFVFGEKFNTLRSFH
ncbi:MAG: DDE-type integrase/transposase/recombinase [Clostridiales bacterium]